MSEDTPEEGDDESPKKKSKMPLILGLVLAIVGGGGGFMAVKMGFIGGGADANAAVDDHATEEMAADLPDLGNPHFVALDAIVVNLPASAGSNFLRFTAQLDVPELYVAEVEAVRPRIIDVLNSYLRAVEITDLRDRAALSRLRSQMLRRVQVVTGEGRVRDLLISEFVLN